MGRASPILANCITFCVLWAVTGELSAATIFPAMQVWHAGMHAYACMHAYTRAFMHSSAQLPAMQVFRSLYSADLMTAESLRTLAARLIWRLAPMGAACALQVFQSLRVPFIIMPMGLPLLIQISVSAKRIATHLALPDQPIISATTSEVEAPTGAPRAAADAAASDAANANGAHSQDGTNGHGGSAQGVAILEMCDAALGWPKAIADAKQTADKATAKATAKAKKIGEPSTTTRSTMRGLSMSLRARGAAAKPMADTGTAGQPACRTSGTSVVYTAAPVAAAPEGESAKAALPGTKRAAANQAATSTPTAEYTVPLRGASLVVHSGELVALNGSVGCGKSTLLAACWGEALVLDGSVRGPSELGLMPQRPFIIGGSVLDNILMGRPLEHDWFARVIRQCALEEDMRQLPHAESTIVGERGVTLSGGQQQRVAVARALYGKPKLLLADDPLSAVDARTQSVILSTFTEFAHGGDGCAILCSLNQPHHLAAFDRVLKIESGVITATDPPMPSAVSGDDTIDALPEVELPPEAAPAEPSPLAGTPLKAMGGRDGSPSVDGAPSAAKEATAANEVKEAMPPLAPAPAPAVASPAAAPKSNAPISAARESKNSGGFGGRLVSRYMAAVGAHVITAYYVVLTCRRPEAQNRAHRHISDPLLESYPASPALNPTCLRPASQSSPSICLPPSS